MEDTVTINGIVYKRVNFIRVKPNKVRPVKLSGKAKKDAKRKRELKQSRKLSKRYKQENIQRRTKSEKAFQDILSGIRINGTSPVKYEFQKIWRPADHDKRFYIIDFYVKSPRKIAFEIDGDSHIGREIYDQDRDACMNRHGVLVVRFTNSQVFRDRELVASRVRELLSN